MKALHFILRGVLLLSVTSTLSFADDKPQAISGAEIINNNCSRCHNARPVQEFSLDEWSVIMPHMREKAHLTGEETEAVMQFFQMLKQPAASSETAQKSAATPAIGGREIMARYGCQGCHSFGGQGGSVGPALDDVVKNKGADFVRRKLQNPQFNNPQSPMPKMPLSEKDIQALAAYLSGQEL